MGWLQQAGEVEVCVPLSATVSGCTPSGSNATWCSTFLVKHESVGGCEEGSGCRTTVEVTEVATLRDCQFSDYGW